MFITQSKKTYRWHILLLLGILLGYSGLYAQNPTEISGIVIDDSVGNPIQFVNIYFEGTSEGTVTDENGKFFLKSKNSYDAIVISFVGYIKKTVRITPGQKQNISIKLESQLDRKSTRLNSSH